MPFKALFSGGKKAGAQPAADDMRAGLLTDTDKLEMLSELESSGLGWFWSTDAEGRITYLSAAIADRLEVPMEQVLGKPLQAVFKSVERGGRSQSLTLKLGARKAFSNFLVGPEIEAADVVIRISGRPVFSNGDTFEGFRGTGSDITEEYRHEEETERLAKYDSLTGLANRHRMKRRLDASPGGRQFLRSAE